MPEPIKSHVSARIQKGHATHQLQRLQKRPIRPIVLIGLKARISQWRQQVSESDDKSLVAQILSAYLSNNTVAPPDLPSVIDSVKKAFSGPSETVTQASDSESKIWEPAVPIKKSVAPDAITCLVCGEKFKSLKRHLQSAHQLTPREYRDAFKLKNDYPIVAPAYAAQRSELAKSLGLGRKVGVKAPAKKATRGRPRKTAAAAE